MDQFIFSSHSVNLAFKNAATETAFHQLLEPVFEKKNWYMGLFSFLTLLKKIWWRQYHSKTTFTRTPKTNIKTRAWDWLEEEDIARGKYKIKKKKEGNIVKKSEFYKHSISHLDFCTSYMQTKRSLTWRKKLWRS